MIRRAIIGGDRWLLQLDLQEPSVGGWYSASGMKHGKVVVTQLQVPQLGPTVNVLSDYVQATIHKQRPRNQRERA